jgi:hypothetical protein
VVRSGDEAETMTHLVGFDIEGMTDEFGGGLAGGDFDHAVEIDFGEIGALVLDGVEAHAALEKFFDEFFARDGIIGEITMMFGRVMFAELLAVFDGVFFEHVDFLLGWG